MSSNNLEFQIYDYREAHLNLESNGDSDEDNRKMNEFVIQVFGRTMDGKSVYTKVKDFRPRFYIKVPDNWGKSECRKLTDWVKGNENKKVYWNYKKCLIESAIIKRKDIDGFTNNKEFKFIVFFFNNYYAMKKFADFFELNKITINSFINNKSFKVYESNLAPMLRCFHIQDIPGCGWVSCNDYQLVEDENKESICDYEVIVSFSDLKPIKKDVNAPFRILSFDIECDSCDGQMPQANRSKDTIIQIGSTYTYLGQSEPYRQHIVTLGSCNPLDNAIVESYQDESELILAWIDEIKNSDADILTGYNIFFFDEKYIYDRSKLLGIDIDCSYFSKIKKHKCIFKETKLASSALGENLLRFYDSPGIVHIDLMKDVQKTYNLESYKLDRVASKFINGQVLKIIPDEKNPKIFKLECNSVNDLHLNDFIHLELQESFVSDDIGEKFQVIELDKTKKIITIVNEEKIDLITECDFKRGKIIWSQAKDDVPPKEIFRLQHTDAKGRAIVAKYCLKDCKLVNLLINKLEVVTKNIEMANVCYVPFQYLFTRGQGIKLFSLCLKEFRNYGYLFPKMTALTDEEKEELGSYEGAIVFDPIPTVSYQAYAVKDYASLYPSSIIHKNMSHETKVVDEAYDNLEGVTYFNAKFNNEGKIEYRRFAKREGEFGVVPTILQTLLKERKAVKKEMEKTDDPFKKAILDAKQLALKVTANSLYGQLGASTSPIRERDVAACTTSTGREMLILGRKFDEEILPWIINGFYLGFKNNDEEVITQLRETYFKDPKNDKLFEEIKSFCEETKDYLFHPMIKYGDTDSVFSCYNLREDFSYVEDKTFKKELLEKIIKFGLTLIKPFLPSNLQEEFSDLYEEYYQIKKLEIPDKLKVLPQPNHWKTILPITEILKQFLKEFVEESLLPWIWTLHDFFKMDLTYLSKDDYEGLLDIKIIKIGQSHINKMGLDRINLYPNEIIGSEREDFIHKIKGFMKHLMKDYLIYPYLKLEKGKLKKKIDFYQGGKYIIDKRSLTHSIKLGIISGELIKKILPFPHDFEYEKTFYPYLILTKKRYVGHKYEFDDKKYKFDYNGIVLKRRDNAPIVKEVCSGIIKRLIEDRDPDGALKFTQDILKRMFDGDFDIKYFLQSRTLKMKESYADWTRIAHVVLSERIGVRDAGNKPQAGDRISFAAIKVPNSKGKLQGELIETPEYIKEQKLKIDYLFYLTNQIEKPALQFLSLVNPKAKQVFEDIKMMEDQLKRGNVSILDYLTQVNNYYEISQ